MLISALTGEGCGSLLDRIERHLSTEKIVFDVDLDAADGAGLHWLYEHGEVLGRVDRAERIDLQVRIAAQRVERLLRRFPEACRMDPAENQP